MRLLVVVGVVVWYGTEERQGKGWKQSRIDAKKKCMLDWLLMSMTTTGG